MPSVCPSCRASLPGPPLPPSCPFCGRAIGGAARGAPADAKVVIQAADGTTSEFKLLERTRIGRHPINHLKLADREISKEHAEIARQGEDFWVQDLNSSNGTQVNGRRITRFKLKDGDQVQLGGTTLTFRAGAGQAGSSPGVTMIQAVAPQVLASVRAEDPRQSQLGFRPEKEINEIADLRRDYEKLRIANEFHRMVGLERDLDVLYTKILEMAFDLLDAENGVILLFDPNTQQLTPAPIKRRAEEEVMVSQTLLEQVVKSHEGVLTQDAIVDARFSAAQSIVAQGIRSAMAVPLLSKGELRGILYLDTRKRAGSFQEKDLRILAGVAAQAAVAIENAELARRIEHEAETRAHLSRFLSPALVEQAQNGQLVLTKGGELIEITILFADIRGFTSMTERSKPQEIVQLLNDYFELMVDEVFANGGVLDKFIGDCIMAMWGAPVARPDDATRAIQAACGMIDRAKEFNEERAAKGLNPVHLGIGVNTGLAVVGNMGSTRRLEYTAIGDAVNLGARLCDVAREDQIVISATTLQRGGEEFEVEAMPPAKVKGKQAAIPVFKVLGPVPKTRART
ncbi:MAG TPA: adenylate/guanylate cyclase domain-containing protein [Myxococcales bacterium]|jgi:adenylate cyclase